jgi:hypothetical protein
VLRQYLASRGASDLVQLRDVRDGVQLLYLRRRDVM